MGTTRSHTANRGKWAQLGHMVLIGESGHRSHSAHRGKWAQVTQCSLRKVGKVTLWS